MKSVLYDGDIYNYPAPASLEARNEKMEEVGLFPPKGKNLDKSPNPNLSPINTSEFNECLGKPQIKQSVKEIQRRSEGERFISTTR